MLPNFRKIALSGAAGVAIAAGAFLAFHLGGIRLNTTASLPIGLYIRTADQQGYAEFCPQGVAGALAGARGYRGPGSCPDGYRPLLKPVVARSGDVVSVTGAGLVVNGHLLPNTAPLLRDSDGRSLPAVPCGIYIVAPGEFWVASSYNRRSFDSRYMGPLAASSVREWLTPVVAWR